MGRSPSLSISLAQQLSSGPQPVSPSPISLPSSLFLLYFCLPVNTQTAPPAPLVLVLAENYRRCYAHSIFLHPAITACLPHAIIAPCHFYLFPKLKPKPSSPINVVELVPSLLPLHPINWSHTTAFNHLMHSSKPHCLPYHRRCCGGRLPER